MSEELQELHRQVNAAKTKRAALIKEIKRLKTESGMKLEAIVRSQVLFGVSPEGSLNIQKRRRRMR